MNLVDLQHIYGDRPYPLRDVAALQYYVVHHTASRLPATLDDALTLIDEIDTFHRSPARGWPGIAYSRAVWRDCYFLLRPRERNGYHTGAGGDTNANGIGDANDFGLGVVLLGDFTDREPPRVTLETLAEGFQWETQQLGLPLLLRGHQDFMATGCPSNGWPSWRQRIVLPVSPAPVSLSAQRIADLETALADVCDRTGDELEAEARRRNGPRKTAVLSQVARLRQVRTQFLGSR